MDEVIYKQREGYYEFKPDLTAYEWCKCPLHDEDTPSLNIIQRLIHFIVLAVIQEEI